MLSRPTALTGWLQRLAQTLATATPRSPLATTRAHCPYCEHETSWAVHAASGFYRCRRCGKNPLDGPRSAA